MTVIDETYSKEHNGQQSQGNFNKGSGMLKTLNALLVSTLTIAGCASAQSVAPLDLIRGEQWQKASIAYETAISQNSYDGVNYYYYGIARARLGDCSLAEPAFERAMSLGVNGQQNGMRSTSLELAKCLAGRGATGEALTIIIQAWEAFGLRDFRSIEQDDAFQLLREQTDYRALSELALPNDALDRNGRWVADITYFERLMIQTHPEPFHSAHRAEWVAQIEALRMSVSSLTDIEITKELLVLASRIGDGHTVLYPPIEGESAWNMIPIWPIWLRDGWYVAGADPSFAHLVGSKIETAAGRNFETIANEAERYLGTDNSVTHLWLASIYLQFAESYGVTDSIPFSFVLPDGHQVSASLPVGAIDRDPTTPFPPPHWESVAPANQAPFAHRLVADTNVVYARVDIVGNSESTSFSDYGRALSEFMEQVSAKQLIVDLRNNNGGNGDLRWEFLRHLMQYEPLQESGSIYVLIGPRTYSASMMLIDGMNSIFDVTFVGMPTGGRPVGYSTETAFELPNSGLTGSISNRFHIDAINANDKRPWVAPDFVAWPNGAEWRSGQDPALEKALQIIQSNEGS